MSERSKAFFNCLAYIKSLKSSLFKMIKFTEVKSKFAETWRVFISGSSSAGKTHFAMQLLAKNYFSYEKVFYYHPDIGESFPVDWSELNKPVLFQAGLPTRQELLEMKSCSCIVLDDLFTEACKSQDISYLFRVLSGKKKIHVIIMTQRYFAETGLNIRNSSNYHVLMSNSDVRTNARVANIMGLAAEFRLAEEFNRDCLYPYIFLDRTNHARVMNLQVYTDIFSRYRKVIFNRMKCYILSEPDFKAHFKKTETNLAVKHDNKKSKESDNSTESEESDADTVARRYRPNSSLERYRQRLDIKRQIRKALHRHQKYTEL